MGAAGSSTSAARSESRALDVAVGVRDLDAPVSPRLAPERIVAAAVVGLARARGHERLAAAEAAVRIAAVAGLHGLARPADVTRDAGADRHPPELVGAAL